MTARTTTSATFERDVLKAVGPVIVDFWAPWCAPCRRVLAALGEILDQHPGRLNILKVNVQEEPDLVLMYAITSLPAVKVFRHGSVEKTILGAQTKSVLEREFATYLA